MSGRWAWRRALCAATLAGLGVSALASCAETTPPTTPVSSGSSSYTIDQPVTKLVLDAPAGTVDISGTDAATSSVQESMRFSGDHRPQSHHDLDHGVLRLGYSCPSGTQHCDIDYRVTVPRGARVEVREQAGQVTVRDLDGSLSVDTQAAEVTGTGLRGPTAAVTSQAGAVSLAFASAPRRVDVRTEVGAVRVALPKNEPYAVDASTTVGATDVTVPVDAASPRHITVQTTTGTASVVPA